MDLTRQRLVTFPRKEMRGRAAGLEVLRQKREDWRSVISRCFECLQIKIGGVPSHLFERFRGLLPSAEPRRSFLSAHSSLSKLSSRPGLRQLVGLSDRSVPGDSPRICALARIQDVVPVFDLQELLPVQPYLNKRLVLFWEPEAINFLILPYKICVLDPEGEFLRGMSFDPHYAVVVHVNPDSTFKQILVFPLGYSFGDETAVRT